MISGYADNTFRWYNATTRAQAAKMFFLASGWTVDLRGAPHFSDVRADQWYYDYIETAYNHGAMKPYADGLFRPGQNISRSEFAYGVVRSKGWALVNPATARYADVPPSNPSYAEIETASAHNIISGYNCGSPGEPCDPQNRPYFRPTVDVVRGQLSKLLYQSMIQP